MNHSANSPSTEHYREWVGRSQTAIDVLEPARSQALGFALGHQDPPGQGEDLPLLHHWLYFWDVQPPSGLGEDGHPARGGFLPPVSLPRRMWAGGELEFHRPLKLGETIERYSVIDSVNAKAGRSGQLVFVTVKHEIRGESGLAVSEVQQIVYREAAPPGALRLPEDTANLPDAPWSERLEPGAILLFRYSALTMNSHRIHYDLPYAKDEEAYPTLVVHGPLQATLLIHLAGRNLDKPIRKFDFRGQAPAFSGSPLYVCGEPTENGASLWTEQAGTRNLVATVTS